MKKRFYHRHSFFITPRIFSGGSIILAVILLFVLFRVIAPGVFLTITAPVSSAGTFVYKNISSVFILASQKQELQNKNQALILQNEALMNRNRALLERVNTIATLIGTTTPRMPGVVANVLSSPIQSPYDTLIIDAGAKSGSAVGDVVLASGGVPIGTIREVAPYYARVLLFSSPGVLTKAWVGASHNQITLKGTGSGTFTASVPHQIKVAIGDLVFVPGAPAFAVGRVARVDAVVGVVMETLRIKPFVNMRSVPVVVVTHRTTS